MSVIKLLSSLLLVLGWMGSSLAATYAYDKLNRLILVTYDDGSRLVYDYDAAGNIVLLQKLPPGVAMVTTATTTTGGSTTTTGSTTSTTQAAYVPGNPLPLHLDVGWNLVGNSLESAINVTTHFGDKELVTTVWKWVAAKSAWAFFAPSLVGQALADYASSKGYDILSEVGPGEGFWVNAKTAHTVIQSGASPVLSSAFAVGGTRALSSGWGLIATGDNPSPLIFSNGLSGASAQTIPLPLNLTTLWAWDVMASRWYFWAPSLVNNGQLGSYIQSKEYLDFNTTSRTLGPGFGFWVNRPQP